MCKPISKHHIIILKILRNKNFKNIVGKGENAGYQHFLFNLQSFLSFQIDFNILAIFSSASAIALNSDILSVGKEYFYAIKYEQLHKHTKEKPLKNMFLIVTP